MATPLIKFIADFNTTLASKVAVGGTSATLTSNLDDSGTTLATGKYGFTIDRKNSSKEYITATVTGTALTNVATLNIATGAETSGFAKEHRKGAEIIISDFVALKRIQDVLETGYVDTYRPTTDYQIATKKYADDLTVGGAPMAGTATAGLTEIATVAEIDANASVGSTGANLVITPANLHLSTYETRIADIESDLTTLVPIVRTYTSSTTWSKPAGLKYVIVEVQAGGGGGGGHSGDYTAGSGGGGGGYCKKLISTASLGATETVTVGAGGAGGTSSSNLGATGGTSSFGAHCSASGGTGGTENAIGGNGGTSSGGDLNISGSAGERCEKSYSGSHSSYYSGAGGSSKLGGSCNASITASGLNGTLYGGGGSGGDYDNSGSGGAGATGIVIVTEYYI